VSSTSDVHLLASVFEGKSSLLGGTLSLNGFTLTNLFQGLISDGVDLVDAVATDVGAGNGVLQMSSPNGAVMLAAVASAVDLS
jgi:hypothetical protein